MEINTARSGSSFRKWFNDLLMRLYFSPPPKALRFSPLQFLAGFIFTARALIHNIWMLLAQVLYREPVLRHRCRSVGDNLKIWESGPKIWGDGDIYIGDNVQFLGENSFLLLLAAEGKRPTLTIQDNTYLGLRTQISVVDEVTIGKYCRLADEVKVFDNNSHSIDPMERRKGVAERLEAAPIVIEDDAWIGTHAIILKGVTIGRAAIVSAGAVVTKDVPPYTIVAGNPAAVVKQLDPGTPETDGTEN